MALLSAETAAESGLDSLSTSQVAQLLRTLRIHTRLLESTHQDARRRVSSSRRRLAYVIDYQLIWRYLNETVLDREGVLELDYLLSQQDLTFILGLGTSIEISSDLARTTGFDPTSRAMNQASSLEAYLQLVSRVQQVRTEETIETLLEKPANILSLQRLADLLDRDNVVLIQDLESNVVPWDEHTFDIAKRILDGARPGRTDNNLADAINLCQVSALRKLDVDYYPFLLTDTRLLLDDNKFYDATSRDDPLLDSALTRAPLAAVYSVVANHIHQDPRAIMEHTTDLAFDGARLQRNLRRSRGYLGKVDDLSSSQWQDIVRDNRLDSNFLRHIAELSEFVEDPLIAEAQRIYDNMQSTAGNWESQHGRVKSFDSPRRLFDLILGVSKALGAQKVMRSSEFDHVWRTALRLEVRDEDNYKVVSLHDRQQRNSHLYFEVEVHTDHYVCRWSGESELEGVISAFNAAFLRFDIHDLTLQAGLRTDVLEFDVQLPITLDELISACEEPVGWIRMNSPMFDLYSDILGAPEVDPVVGLITEDPNWQYIADLFSTTASRFLFEVWVEEAFRSCDRRRLGA